MTSVTSQVEYHSYGKNLPLELNREILIQLSLEQLVEIIIEQALATIKQNSRI
ncbi:MAG: hypothetical protein V7K46_23510 [Nostoc sp.]